MCNVLLLRVDFITFNVIYSTFSFLGISELLIESTRFCIIDDNICVSEHLPETYNDSKTELVETISFMLAECAKQEDSKVSLSSASSSTNIQEKQMAVENVFLRVSSSVEEEEEEEEDDINKVDGDDEVRCLVFSVI